MKKLMILGAGILQLPAIEKARDMGLDVIVLDRDPDAVGFRVSGIKKELISTIDTPAILETARHYHIDGIMTLASDMPMQSVAAVCHDMGLTGISEDTALKATNKAYMRDALKQHNVPIPLYFRVKGREEYLKAVQTIIDKGYKCIIKPADNSGSRGVCLLETGSDLNKVYDYTLQYSRGGEIVVEEFMEGPEVSVETLAENGLVHVLQITDKLTTGAPYFVEMGHNQPSCLDDDIKRKIADVAIAANKAIGIENGPSHTEIKVTKEGPKIVELGARLGGDCITTHLVPLSTGIDMVQACIHIALGEKAAIQNSMSRGAAIRYFQAPNGVIKKISGLEEAARITGVVQVSVVHGPGEVAGEIKSSNDRTGFIIAEADTPQEAVQLCEEAITKIRIECEK